MVPRHPGPKRSSTEENQQTSSWFLLLQIPPPSSISLVEGKSVCVHTEANRTRVWFGPNHCYTIRAQVSLRILNSPSGLGLNYKHHIRWCFSWRRFSTSRSPQSGEFFSNMCKSICREQSVRKSAALRKAARPARMRPLSVGGAAPQGLTSSCLYPSQRVNTDYENELLSLQTHRAATHLNGWTIQVCSINKKRIFLHKYLQIPTLFKFWYHMLNLRSNLTFSISSCAQKQNL